MIQLNLTHDEYVALLVVLVSPHTVASALIAGDEYDDDAGERRTRLAQNLKSIYAKCKLGR